MKLAGIGSVVFGTLLLGFCLAELLRLTEGSYTWVLPLVFFITSVFFIGLACYVGSKVGAFPNDDDDDENAEDGDSENQPLSHAPRSQAAFPAAVSSRRDDAVAIQPSKTNTSSPLPSRTVPILSPPPPPVPPPSNSSSNSASLLPSINSIRASS
jgi:hypothetical protein